MNKKICFLFFALPMIILFVSGCQTTGNGVAKNTWQAVLRADDWVHRNLW